MGWWIFILLILGLILLIKGADVFVDGASYISKYLGIPPVVVGLTVVAIGTSAPELAVSISGALKGEGSIVLGNILGSNIANTLLVLGVISILKPIAKKEIVIYDINVSILSLLLFIVFLQYSFFFITDKNHFILNGFQGLLLLLIFCLYLFFLIRKTFLKIKADKLEFNQKNKQITKNHNNTQVIKNSFKIVFGLLSIILGSEWVVRNASIVANFLIDKYEYKNAEALVGITMIALGTSLPELVTSITSIIKKEKELALGNVFGSNIFNLLLVGGTASLFNPLISNYSFLVESLILLFFTGIFVLVVTQFKIFNRFWGLLFIFTYFITLSINAFF